MGELAEMSPAAYVVAMRGEFEQVMKQVAEVVNAAPEEKVGTRWGRLAPRRTRRRSRGAWRRQKPRFLPVDRLSGRRALGLSAFGELAPAWAAKDCGGRRAGRWCI